MPMKKFADIVIPLPLQESYEYSVPPSMEKRISKGSRVLVPFGRKLLTGYVIEIKDSCSYAEEKLKDIKDILDEEPLISDSIMTLTQWASDYYMCSWGELLKASLPAGINIQSKDFVLITSKGQKKLKSLPLKDLQKEKKWQLLQQISQQSHTPLSRLKKMYSPALLYSLLNQLTEEGVVELKQQLKKPAAKRQYLEIIQLIEPSAGNYDIYYQLCKRSKAQQQVLETLINCKTSIPLKILQSQLGISRQAVISMQKKGILRINKEPVKNSIPNKKKVTADNIRLTPLQNQVIENIYDAVAKGEFTPILLHGVTGSGKTEIYILSIMRVLQKGKKALLLTPEISLTPQLSRRFRSHFGSLVSVLHSGLTPGERLREWWNIKEGNRTVVIGTRSAIFAPLDNVGIIIVDEEHDTSYKQEENPRYNARDLAVMRAKIENAIALLGSATPSLESYYNVEKEKYQYLQLPERIFSEKLPQVEIVDMKEEFKQEGKRRIFSRLLLSEIENCLSRKEQILILLNRRGYASYLQCRKCGYIPLCVNCSMSLTYHLAEHKLKCHYCGYSQRPPERCKECEGEYIHYIGQGTEKIEEEIGHFFPDAEVARMDRDTTRYRGAAEKIITRFTAGEIDILIGTQMIAKGHDIHNVTLMGIISADIALGLPDFRSSERTFQLLTQASGRSGRGELPGKVVIQTNHPNHYSIEMAEKQNYQSFYQKEMRFRRIMKYPPFTHLVNIIIKGRSLDKLKKKAIKVASKLREKNSRGIWILGPSPAPLSKIKGNYRYQIVLKGKNRKRLKKLIEDALSDLRRQHIAMKDISIDIDPLSLM
jgi:primosomal protein N' (replication factor Y)